MRDADRKLTLFTSNVIGCYRERDVIILWPPEPATVVKHRLYMQGRPQRCADQPCYRTRLRRGDETSRCRDSRVGRDAAVRMPVRRDQLSWCRWCADGMDQRAVVTAQRWHSSDALAGVQIGVAEPDLCLADSTDRPFLVSDPCVSWRVG